MKKGLLISTIVSTILFGTSFTYATSLRDSNITFGNKQKNSLRVQNIIQNESNLQKERLKNSSKEIVKGLNKTFNAIKELKDNRVNDAKKSLKEASNLFNIALKSNPELDLIPIAQDIDISTFQGDANSVQQALDLIVKLIKKHNTQEARNMLLPLEDRMLISTQLLPMKLYPITTKDALKALDNGKKDNALKILNSGLNSIVIETILIPIPLLIAENVVMEASQVDKSKKDKITKLLLFAQDELKKAELLGYTQKHSLEYRVLVDGIKNIESQIKNNNNEVEKLYEKEKKDFKSLISTVKKDILHEEAKAKINIYEDRENKQAIKGSSVFKSDAKLDENKTIK